MNESQCDGDESGECRSVELVKTFAEDLMSVALHPAGHMLLAGCIDKLRLLNITMDSLKYGLIPDPGLSAFPCRSKLMYGLIPKSGAELAGCQISTRHACQQGCAHACLFEEL